MEIPTFPTIRGKVPFKKHIKLKDSTGFEELERKFQSNENKTIFGQPKTVEQKVEDYQGLGPGRIIIKGKTNTPEGIFFYPDNTEYAKAAVKDISDYQNLEQLFQSISILGGAAAVKSRQNYNRPRQYQLMLEKEKLNTTKPKNYNQIIEDAFLPGNSLVNRTKTKQIHSYENRPVYIPKSELAPFQKGEPLMTTTGGDQPNEFQQLVLNLEKEDSFPESYNFPSNQPTPFISEDLNEELGPDGNRLEGLTYQEIQSIGRAAKSYELKRAYKDAGTIEGYARMTKEVEKAFSDLLGDDFDRDLVRQYMLAVSKHEAALTELQKITNDKTGKLWDKQHANALRNLEHSGRMLGNKGLFPAFNYPDVLDQTPLDKPIVKIEREGNRPDPRARGADFQRVLSRVLGKPLSLHESILYFYDQDMFYFYKELSPLQRQQLVDSSRTRSGGRIKSELTVAENINQALESMKFGEETMSGKLGRSLTDKERLKALVDLATSELLKKRKYKRTDFKTIPRQGNVFYDIDTGEVTDYSPDPGTGSSWDIEDPDPDNKYSK